MENVLTSAIQESLPENVTPESLPENLTRDVKGVSPEAESSQPAAETAKAGTSAKEEKVPFHEHPRWKEVMQDRDYWKQVAMEAIDRSKQPVAVPVAPQKDPYEGMDAEQKAFWMEQRRIAREEAERVAEEKSAVIQQEQRETRQMVTALVYKEFRAKYPEIVPDSSEERQIAVLFQRGYSLDDARNTVFREDDIKAEREKAAKEATEKKLTQQKAAANLENSSTASVPSTSPLNPQKKLSVREFVEQQMKAHNM